MKDVRLINLSQSQYARLKLAAKKAGVSESKFIELIGLDVQRLTKN